jgi:hypothetical protein
LKSPATDQSPAKIISLRVENLSPETDWPLTWSLARTQGLDSELTSFLFKLLHGLLPTQDRVTRFGLAGPNQGVCQLCLLEVEDQVHAFFSCPKSMLAGLALLGYVQTFVPNLSPESALKLDLGSELSEQKVLATVCVLATGLKYIWQARQDKKQVATFRMRAEIEAIISILRKTRHREAGDHMMEMININ